MTNLARLLTDTATRHPDRLAVRLDEAVLTYRQLVDAVARCAGELRALGVGVGDRVAAMLPNGLEVPVVYYAILRLGAVVVPMSPLLKERETAYHLNDSGALLIVAWQGVEPAARAGAEAAGARCVIVNSGFVDRLDPIRRVDDVVDRDDTDTAEIVYTSGTTGVPKGAELTHGGLYTNAKLTAETILEVRESDVMLGALPLFHVFGQTCTMNASCYAGALLTLLPRFDAARALEVIQRDRVTVFLGVPTMFTALSNFPQREKYDVSSLRLCGSAGASLPIEVLKRFEEASACTLLEGYGMTESSGNISFQHPRQHRRPGSIGTPMAGVEMKVVADEGHELPHGEVGEILVRGHNVMKGYWNRAAATAETVHDGWLKSGDLAWRDEDGLYFIVDRKKDTIIRGGYTIYPREVEEVLYENPAIHEAAVVGVPDGHLGEEVAALLVAKEGMHLDLDELKEHVRGQIAAYKYPRLLWLVAALPKGPSGKILKREARLMANELRSR